jgi:hypothetical protein
MIVGFDRVSARVSIRPIQAARRSGHQTSWMAAQEADPVLSENSIFVSRSAFILVDQSTETVVSTDQT